MKKLIHKPCVLAAVLIVIYLFGVFLGLYTAIVYPVYFKQKADMLSRSQSIAREYTEGTEDTIDFIKSSYVHILIYDTEWNCLRYVTPDSDRPSTDFDGYFAPYMQAVLSGSDIFDMTFSYFSKKMSHLWLVSGSPMMKDGSVAGAAFLIRNLDNLQEVFLGYLVCFTIFYWLTVYVLLWSLRRKRKLDELRQNYIDNVTHALKTPVASIKALAETLCDGVEPDVDKQRVYCGMILREVNRQDHMIRDILELSKLQNHGMDFSRTEVLASEVFGQTLDKYATLCDCGGIALHISEKIPRLPPLDTNEACVKQLLEILLDNALKFVKEGGDIWVEASVSRRQAVICVRDNGIGISKEDQPHIFERFYQCSQDPRKSGSGLGLAIAREIAAGLKEKLWVESDLDKGSAFFFTIHLKTAA